MTIRLDRGAYATIVETFVHTGRFCVIIKSEVVIIGEFHNGYVSVLKKNSGINYNEFKVDCVELSYSGSLERFHGIVPRVTDYWLLGFTSVSYEQEQKTHEAVKNLTLELVEELIQEEI
jgi:hypothetical protein